MSTQTSLFPEDICAGNHHDNPASRDAFDKLVPRLPNLQHQVLKYAAGKPRGFTVKGVVRDLHIVHQTASGRISELKAGELVAATTARRNGCFIHLITDLGKRTLAQWEAPNDAGIATSTPENPPARSVPGASS